MELEREQMNKAREGGRRAWQWDRRDDTKSSKERRKEAKHERERESIVPMTEKLKTFSSNDVIVRHSSHVHRSTFVCFIPGASRSGIVNQRVRITRVASSMNL